MLFGFGETYTLSGFSGIDQDFYILKITRLPGATVYLRIDIRSRSTRLVRNTIIVAQASTLLRTTALLRMTVSSKLLKHTILVRIAELFCLRTPQQATYKEPTRRPEHNAETASLLKEPWARDPVSQPPYTTKTIKQAKIIKGGIVEGAPCGVRRNPSDGEQRPRLLKGI